MTTMATATSELTVKDLVLDDVNQHDIWDERESSVANANTWRQAYEAYKQTSDFQNGIPQKIHQIWIGSRQPPCVWIDTWRVDYMRKYSSDNEWTYKLWDNDSVTMMQSHEQMINQDIFNRESSMPQCQADILRLELLYQYGGVYIDADIISTLHGDLKTVLHEAQHNGKGFVITYEPDTKDKPYSILGNSIIACTPKHPFILMLMYYIQRIYDAKRPYYGVEWVTGPLTYTKVLIQSGLHDCIYIPEAKRFYPAFHYVPNPSMIDLDSLGDDTFCFQFGYTCSGLSQWVEQNNCCRNAHECSYHKNIEYPLGKLKQFRKAEQIDGEEEGEGEEKEIPTVIHQIYLNSFNSNYEEQLPHRWMDTWRQEFCKQNAEYRYELWTWQKLKDEIGEFYCANLYDNNSNKMDMHAIRLLALEIINSKGGIYIPLSTIYNSNSNNNTDEHPLNVTSSPSTIYKNGSIIGSVKGGCETLIHDLYHNGSLHDENKITESSNKIISMGFGDHISAFTSFKTGSRFLGAGEIHTILSSSTHNSMVLSNRAILSWAYDCQVPVYIHDTNESALRALKANPDQKKIVLDLNDSDATAHLSTMIDEIPGILHNMHTTNEEWDYIILNAEWESDRNGLDTYKLTSPFRAPNTKYFGYIINSSKRSLAATSDVSIEHILSLFDSCAVQVASLKSTFPVAMAAVFNAMPKLHAACEQLTHGSFVPSFERDHEETVDGGALFKGFLQGQVAFELQMDRNNVLKHFMYRSWVNGGINCECRFSIGLDGTSIDTLRVFDGGHVLHDISGATV